MNKKMLEVWLRWLEDNGLAFHLDDDPRDCLSTVECDIDNIAEIHDLMWNTFTASEIWDTAGAVWNIGGCE